MNAVLIVILIIEVLFFILCSYYLNKKNGLHIVKKVFMFIMFLIILIVLNITIINLYTYKYIRDNYKYKIEFLNKEINNRNQEIEKNNSEFNLLKKEIEKYKEIKKEYEDSVLENDKVKNDLEKKKQEKETLELKYNKLKNEYSDLLKESEYIISPFPTYNQFPNYPNGCESVALHLLLKYNGVDVNVEEIVEKLKKGDKPYKKNGKLYGGDPEIEFVGDPRSKSGYGVYEKPIIDVAEYYKNGIKNITGSDLSDVLDIVALGKPVQVWVSINLKDTYVCTKWTATSTGRGVRWLCGLHSLVIIGFNDEKVITSDPYTGKIEYYEKEQFEKIYNTYGKRAIYYD